MNTTIKKVALVFASVALFTFANAQKIAHVNLDSLIATMPEAKTAKDVAQSYYKGIENEILAMQQELETKYQKYLEEDGKGTMSNLVKEKKQKELTDLQKSIEDFRMQAQTDYQRKTSELMLPIYEKAKKAIELVAKEGGYKYVLDTTPGQSNVLYSEPTDDIYAAAKKKLDSMPAAVIPGGGNSNGVNSTNGGTKPKTAPAPKK